MAHVERPAGLASGTIPATYRIWRDPRVGDVALATLGILSVFGTWQLASALHVLPTYSVPAPLDMLRGIGVLVTDAQFVPQVVDTLTAWVSAVVLASVFAIPTGLLMGYIASLATPGTTVVHALRSVPSTAMIPIAILVFGLGATMKIAVATYATSWPLLLNAMYGVRSAEGQMITAGRSLGWGRWKLLRRVILPAAAPSIVTGLRLAATISLLVTLATELLGARSGIATLLIIYEEAQRPEVVYAGIVIIGIFGMTVHYVLSFLERRAIPWGHAFRGGR